LMDGVREVHNLRLSELRDRRGLGRMAFFEERPDGAAVAVVKDDLRADQVSAALGAAGARSVAGDALGGIDFAAADGGGFVDDLLIGGTWGEGGAPSTAGRRGSVGRGAAAAWRSWAVL